MKATRARIMWNLSKRLLDVGYQLIEVAVKEKQFSGFTGNTQTSISVGVYMDGVLKAYQQGLKGQDGPRIRKIQRGKEVYLKNPYEGPPRAVTGKVNTTLEYGTESALKFLQGYKTKSSRGVSLVMIVGTEYAEFINIGPLGPITSAYNAARNLVWKDIVKGLKI